MICACYTDTDDQVVKQIDLRVQEHYFEYTMTIAEQYQEYEPESLRTCTVELSELQARPEWHDNCNWTLLKRGPTNSGSLVNMTALTRDSRMAPGILYRMWQMPKLLNVYVPFSSGTFMDMDFFVTLTNLQSTLTCNLPYVTYKQDKGGASTPFLTRPILTLDGPDKIPADGSVSLQLSALYKGQPIPKPVTVNLQAKNGYLPKTRFVVQDDVQVKAMALGLVPGDIMTVKAGFRFYDSVAEKELVVV